MTLTISYVVPAHNEEATLEPIIAAIAERLGRDFPGSEIVIVENGSIDETAEVAASLATTTRRGSGAPSVLVLKSEQGLGHAMREGVAASTGELVIMAGGLAFGFTDLDNALELDPRPPFVIGSKAHPCSRLVRSHVREISTAGFKILRRVLLGTRIGDSQGSFILDGELARTLFPMTVEPGYVAQAEVVALAELAGVELAEVPVDLRDEDGRSSVKPVRTSIEMLRGLLRIRRRRTQMRTELIRAGVVGAAAD